MPLIFKHHTDNLLTKELYIKNLFKLLSKRGQNNKKLKVKKINRRKKTTKIFSA
jgi:hypothetical protein